MSGRANAALELSRDRQPGNRARLLTWKPHRKNTLRGYASVEFASGLIVNEIGVHTSHGKPWAAPPSRPWVKGNALVLDPATGKSRWQPLLEFRDQWTRARWSAEVVAALLAEHPDALDDADAL